MKEEKSFTLLILGEQRYQHSVKNQFLGAYVNQNLLNELMDF